MGKLDKFLASCGELTGQSGAYQMVTFLVSICFGLFAFTCLIGFMSFTEMCAVRISSRKGFIVLIRLLCLFVISFGRALGFKRFCQYTDGLLQPAAAVSWSEVCNPGVEALRKTGRHALYV